MFGETNFLLWEIAMGLLFPFDLVKGVYGQGKSAPKNELAEAGVVVLLRLGENVVIDMRKIVTGGAANIQCSSIHCIMEDILEMLIMLRRILPCHGVKCEHLKSGKGKTKGEALGSCRIGNRGIYF
jgi:hypothetical protein